MKVFLTNIFVSDNALHDLRYLVFKLSFLAYLKNELILNEFELAKLSK